MDSHTITLDTSYTSTTFWCLQTSKRSSTLQRMAWTTQPKRHTILADLTSH